ncbi:MULTISPECIES: NAD(P)/FAD-dependent oxidoreductase [Kosmotoga]|jgi:thioredoxin reductase|uniref:FAD-dependent pyridine nucleotide-disulphide oxidoreductase n=1 Tax=Kosmotoga olearia (strain ATCC BAA-1733 / DSM 21960 / TBF 19.5.1) TaxID=521045 RepID=C5CHR9_KOSOT|nr:MULTISPECIES: NAD(P)/FAD-dependent oxidoreductase [Kosmotoga]ACR80745.1 FAD-dependent pyridine nucleotide-disulphide oxidoreductase [Kosmotoga olearia TBF 19.5.1]OAA19190.1 hypothetical protein DU53_11270 [Kosmotoga sp. DU53]
MFRTKVAIIGAGPAGISCAIQLKHAGVDFEIYEKSEIGGTVKNANLIENVPGFDPLTGEEFANKLEKHLQRLKIVVNMSQINKIQHQDNFFILEANDCMVVSEYVVLATGTVPRTMPDFEVPERTFYEVRKMRHIKNSTIAVIGSGEAAYDSALNLTKNRNRVHLFTKKEPQNVAKRLLKKVISNDFVEVHLKEPVVEILKIEDNWYGARTDRGIYVVDYFLISIGRVPNLALLKGLHSDSLTNLFLCGDAKRGRLGQISIAIGDGVAAAMDIIGLSNS